MPAPTELLPRLFAALDGELAAAEALRERLHAHPEPAYAEHELRQTERTGAPFAATGAAMHGCGHDIHTSPPGLGLFTC